MPFNVKPYEPIKPFKHPNDTYSLQSVKATFSLLAGKKKPACPLNTPAEKRPIIKTD
jgi:hypothetical protein